MALTCFIRYQIDPFQREAFREYARHWLQLENEAYRMRLKSDPEGRRNFALAQEKRLILREERTFLENVEPA